METILSKKIVPIIVGLVLLFVVFFAGVLVQKQSTAQKINTLEKLQSLFGSKTLQDREVYIGGKVTKISGGKITLTVENESLEVSVSKDAEIIAFVYPDKGPLVPQQKDISFAEIKIGDEISANVKIKPDGQFEVVGIKVMPKLPQ